MMVLGPPAAKLGPWIAVAVTLLLSCERAPDTQPAKKEKPEEPCIANSLRELTPGWKEQKECTAENSACRDACWNGNADACFNRAIAIQNSTAMEDEADALFKHACKLGLATGCTNWAAGQWLEHQLPWRCLFRIFEKTCAVKDPYGCSMMGRLLIQDGRTPVDVARGSKILEDACNRYKGGACRMIAWYIETGRIPGDQKRIPELMKQACDGGDDAACGKHQTVDDTVRARD